MEEEEVKSTEEWKPYIQPALTSKKNELKLVGYQEVTEEEIWNCVTDQVWKGQQDKRLYQVIADIFHLPANTYMNYIRLGALQVKDEDLKLSIQALTENNG